MISIVLALLQAAATVQQAPTAHCHFNAPSAPGKHWEGGCGAVFDQTPKMTLDSVSAVTTGRWRSDLSPVQVWAGEMTDDGSKAHIELEVYPRGQTILRTPYGWFEIPHYHERPDSLSFELDTATEAAPSDLDRRIVLRADSILSSVAVWNRADDRRCPAGAKTWSIYCAMERATAEVSGGIHHRRPAMEVVRLIIEARTAGRNYQHRLMGYNNDAATTLSDVHAVFRDALAKMNAAPTVAVAPPAPTAPTVSAKDLKVIDRALQLLATSDSWNRAETQNCPANGKTFGIYCALMKALEDVNGSVDESSPVLSEARTIIDFVAVKHYNARLVNYNNDQGTSFADIQSFFRILRNRIARRLAA